jgi:hypothetical protein
MDRCGEYINPLPEHLPNRHFSLRSGLEWVPEGVFDDICSLSNKCFVTLVRVLVKAVQRGHKIGGAAEMLYNTDQLCALCAWVYTPFFSKGYANAASKPFHGVKNGEIDSRRERVPKLQRSKATCAFGLKRPKL